MEMMGAVVQEAKAEATGRSRTKFLQPAAVPQ